MDSAGITAALDSLDTIQRHDQIEGQKSPSNTDTNNDNNRPATAINNAHEGSFVADHRESEVDRRNLVVQSEASLLPTSHDERQLSTNLLESERQ